jgi:hypothetical protein
MKINTIEIEQLVTKNLILKPLQFILSKHFKQ